MTDRNGIEFDIVRFVISGNHFAPVENEPRSMGSGSSKHGITQDMLTFHLGRRASKEEVRKLSYHDALEIYVNHYVTPFATLNVHEKVLLVLVDTAINHTLRAAIEMLQKCVGAGVSGLIDRETIQAAREVDPSVLCGKLIAARIDRYLDVCKKNPSQKVFLVDWMARTSALMWAAYECV